jgi:hypothetical protein
MSYVTDVILVMPLGMEMELIPTLNAWLMSEEGGQCGTFADIGEHGGGRKAHQVEIFSGAFNYLPLQNFLKFLGALPVSLFEPYEKYNEREEVMLIVRDENWRAPAMFRVGQTLNDVEIPEYES